MYTRKKKRRKKNILGYYVKNLIWDMKLLNYLKFLVSAEQVKILRYYIEILKFNFFTFFFLFFGGTKDLPYKSHLVQFTEELNWL